MEVLSVLIRSVPEASSEPAEVIDAEAVMVTWFDAYDPGLVEYP